MFPQRSDWLLSLHKAFPTIHGVYAGQTQPLPLLSELLAKWLWAELSLLCELLTCSFWNAELEEETGGDGAWGSLSREQQMELGTAWWEWPGILAEEGRGVCQGSWRAGRGGLASCSVNRGNFCCHLLDRRETLPLPATDPFPASCCIPLYRVRTLNLAPFI